MRYSSFVAPGSLRDVATEVNLQGEDRIGNYRFVRILLQGQNSSVMEVVQEGTGKKFALKQLLPGKAADPEERKIFELEAKLGMQLKHPNLVHVFEYVKDKKQPYFVMDFFPSTHMRLILAKQQLYDEFKPRLRRIIEQTAAGIAYMHDKGFVHRDIKPENVIVNKTGEVRVIDYSLSMKLPKGFGKMFAAKPPCQGTHSYMSPEQIRRLPLAVQSDIYSFGIMLYEFASKRKPFNANSGPELLRKHLNDTPSPLGSVDKNITPEFSDLVMKMVKKKPADRPQNMHEFMSLFSRMRIYKTDPDPSANRGF
jgi:serine/threonine protein kinase